MMISLSSTQQQQQKKKNHKIENNEITIKGKFFHVLYYTWLLLSILS